MGLADHRRGPEVDPLIAEDRAILARRRGELARGRPHGMFRFQPLQFGVGEEALHQTLEVAIEVRMPGLAAAVLGQDEAAVVHVLLQDLLLLVARGVVVAVEEDDGRLQQFGGQLAAAGVLGPRRVGQDRIDAGGQAGAELVQGLLHVGAGALVVLLRVGRVIGEGLGQLFQLVRDRIVAGDQFVEFYGEGNFAVSEEDAVRAAERAEIHAMNFFLRDQIDWITKSAVRFRAAAVSGVVYGVTLLACAVTVYQ